MKQTIEEAAKQGAEGYNIVGQNIYKSGYIAGAEWQSKQLPWISVKEQLPEESGYYFVTDGCAAGKAYFLKNGISLQKSKNILTCFMMKA